MADKAKGGDLLGIRVTGVRRTFASDMGVLVPPIRLRDNLQLGNNEYQQLCFKGQCHCQQQAHARPLAGHERHQQQRWQSMCPQWSRCFNC